MSEEGTLRFSLNERKPGTMACPSAGKEISLGDPATAKRVMEAIHRGSAEVDWAVLAYEGQSVEKLGLLASGNGGIDELITTLHDDIVAYALLRVVDVVDGYPTHRFVYISWFGEFVPAARKARLAVNKKSVTEVFGHYNVELVTSAKDDLAKEVIMGKVQDASGSRNREVQGPSAPQAAAKAKETPAWGIKTGGGSAPKVASGGSSGQVEWVDEGHLKQVLQEVRTDSSPVTWALFGYQSKNSIGLVAKGGGDIKALQSHLDDSQVLYGVLRTNLLIDATLTTKFAYINWVGENVSAMVKGRLTTHAGDVQTFLQPYHITLRGTSRDDFTPATLQARLQELRGSKV